jgi:uncharacterized protein (TIGR00288 family)
MGMRSDLSKELKTLLNSDIIKGKVTVQRAYADWRRYPQYIVSLSENSVDLIYAPAYGSSKKNATDIRMAIDAIELVFIRPEIATFILLTGDSDFSSLVLKLKEYGKYVIGVGIQESSSDILVQNCDEYYSYTSLAGLRKTTDSESKAVDPWVLVEQAVQKMSSRDDVMRSDRLKQVMMEIDSTFDEGNFGFSKFSKFLSEASSRNLVRLRKLENGQHEVSPVGGSGKGRDGGEEKRKELARDRSKKKESAERGGGPKGKGRKGEPSRTEARQEPPKDAPADSEEGTPLQAAYSLLEEAMRALGAHTDGFIRDSDLKRRMLELDPSFDEGELGFGKFSRFLRQAHDHEIVDLVKGEEGTYQVSSRAVVVEGERGPSEPARQGPARTPEIEVTASVSPASTPSPHRDESAHHRLRMRRGGTHHRKEEEGPPPLLEGQVVGVAGSAAEGSGSATGGSGGARQERSGNAQRTPRGKKGGARAATDTAGAQAGSDERSVDVSALGLPTEPNALTRYLTNSYKGVGRKTAERLVEEFGTDLFQVMQDQPGRIGSVIPPNRADQLLEAWRTDLVRRLERKGGESDDARPRERERASNSNRRTRKGSRGRGRRDSGSSS